MTHTAVKVMSSTHVWIHTGRPASVNNKVCCKIQTDVEQQKSSPLKTGLVCVQMIYKCMWVNWVWCVCVCVFTVSFTSSKMAAMQFYSDLRIPSLQVGALQDDQRH